MHKVLSTTLAMLLKKTPVKVYLKGQLSEIEFPEGIQTFIEDHSGVIFGDWK